MKVKKDVEDEMESLGYLEDLSMIVLSR